MDRELLLELGTEELPASWLPVLTRQIRDGLDGALRAHRLVADAPVEGYSTPRRLTARIAKIAERQTDLEELVTGPPVAAAFGADGAPTPAASGFARKNNVDVAQLEHVETPKGTYLGIRKHQRGKAAVDVLPDVLATTLRSFSFPEGDALGRVPRGREGRAAVRTPNPLDSLPLRRARRPVHHPAHRDCPSLRRSRKSCRRPSPMATAFSRRAAEPDVQ